MLGIKNTVVDMARLCVQLFSWGTISKLIVIIEYKKCLKSDKLVNIQGQLNFRSRHTR